MRDRLNSYDVAAPALKPRILVSVLPVVVKFTMSLVFPVMLRSSMMFRLHTSFGFSYVFGVRPVTVPLIHLSRFIAIPIIMPKHCIRFSLNMSVVFAMVLCFSMVFCSNTRFGFSYAFGLELVMTLN